MGWLCGEGSVQAGRRSPAAEELTGADTSPRQQLWVLLSGQFVVYKPKVPPCNYWKREDLFSTVSLACEEVQSGTEL